MVYVVYDPLNMEKQKNTRILPGGERLPAAHESVHMYHTHISQSCFARRGRLTRTHQHRRTRDKIAKDVAA